MSSSISKLKEYHDKQKSSNSPPSYSIEPHANNQFLSICRYKHFLEKGYGTKKQDAKADSASKMLMNLNSSYISPENSEVSVNSSTVLSCKNLEVGFKALLNDGLNNNLTSYNKTSNDIIKKFLSYSSPDSSDIFNKNFKTWTEPNVHFNLKELKTSNVESILSHKFDKMNPVVRFMRLINTLSIKYNYTKLKAVQPNVIVARLKLSYESLIIGAIGNDEVEAVENLVLDLMERNLMPCYIEYVLEDVRNSFQRNHSITDDTLMILHATFGKILGSALELIDSDSIAVLKLKHCSLHVDECLLKVVSNNKPSYTLFLRTNYCQCTFYQQKVLGSRLYPACKHVIAANLGYIWNKYKKYEIDFNTYKTYIDDLLNPQ